MSSLDGLSEMEARRDSRMKPPPPRHSPPAKVKREDPKAAPPAAPSAPTQASAEVRAAPRSVVTTEKQAEEKVAPSTIYFDSDTDDWIEQACIIGRRGKPKLNSRSAFVRLAVRRLMEEMTPTEAVEFLRAEAMLTKSTSTGGRPRR